MEMPVPYSGPVNFTSCTSVVHKNSPCPVITLIRVDLDKEDVTGRNVWLDPNLLTVADLLRIKCFVKRKPTLSPALLVALRPPPVTHRRSDRHKTGIGRFVIGKLFFGRAASAKIRHFVRSERRDELLFILTG